MLDKHNLEKNEFSATIKREFSEALKECGQPDKTIHLKSDLGSFYSP